MNEREEGKGRVTESRWGRQRARADAITSGFTFSGCFHVSVKTEWVNGVKPSAVVVVVFNGGSYSIGWMYTILTHIVLFFFTCPFVLVFRSLTSGRHLNFS